MRCLGFLLVESVQVTVRFSECTGYAPEDLDNADVALEMVFAIID
jgi:hypothetical protein